MKCLKCGMENKEESKFCLNCGNNLEQQMQQTNQQNMQQPVQPQQMVNQPVYAQPVYNQQTKKSNKGLIIGLSVGGGVLLLIIIVVVIVFNFIHGAKKALDNIEVDDNITINGNDDKKDTKDDKKTSAYSIGDPVTLVDGSKWHVLEYDGKDNITLMLDELVVEETGYGKSAAAEDQKYENSLV